MPRHPLASLLLAAAISAAAPAAGQDGPTGAGQPAALQAGERESRAAEVIGRFTQIWADAEIDEEQIALMAEELQDLADNPLAINGGDLQPLVQAQLMTDYQAALVARYRKSHGDIRTLWELALLPDFTPADIDNLQPFVDFASPERRKTLRQMFRRARHEAQGEYRRNLERADGYRDRPGKPRAYPGSPDKVYARYTVSSRGNYSAGVTAKKDPGEQLLRGGRRDGFDFYSAHASLDFDRAVKEVFLGDYTVNLANGLTLGRSLMGKGAAATSVKRNDTRARKYSGAAEHGFLRGAAATFQGARFRGLVFFSDNDIDATLEGSAEAGTLRAVSVPQSGYHRTEGELAKRKALRRQVAGAAAHWSLGDFKAGLNAAAVGYGHPYWPDTALYNTLVPRGDTYANVSADYQYIGRGLIAWGEAATSAAGGLALMQGAQIRASDIAQLALHYRRYSPGYYAPMAAAFGDGSSASNEEGLYAGATIYPFATIQVNAYADLFRFPWAKYGRSAPSQGADYLLDASWQPRRTVKVSARWRHKTSSRDAAAADTSPARRLSADRVSRAHVQGDIRLTPALESQTRAAAAFFRDDAGRQSGWMLYHEMRWTPRRAPVSLAARLALFSTDSYDTRLYAYERDLPGSFSVPALSGRGARAYLMLTWDVAPRVRLYAKWSRTTWPDLFEVGSGHDRVEGNRRSQLALRLKARF